MEKPTEVIVVRTGTANLASVCAGLERINAAPRITENPADVSAAARLVLPGVGTLAAAMARLEAADLVEILRARIAAGRPTLAICLGLQMLCETSEENPGLRGLGVIAGSVTRFPDTLRVPQLGWNRIVPEDGARLLEAGYAYFANSFCLREPPPGWTAAFAEYGGPFVAALERGNVLACQFHPELSSKFGIDLLKRWLTATRESGGGAC